jgi:hypothetical protein
MNSINRMFAALGLAAMVVVVPAGGMAAEQSTSSAQDVVDNWYKLVLELTRHTPTYTPPVASRSYAYIGVAAFEVVASGSDKLQTLAGQLNGLTPLPKRAAGKKYDDGVALEHAMALVVGQMFENTGPTGHRAMDALKAQLDAEAAKGLPADEIKRSEAYGTAVATHILAWSKDDGGASVVNMGFPLTYKLNPAPGHWVPTNTVAQQQAPLLPDWGNNRPLAMPKDASCACRPRPPIARTRPPSITSRPWSW